MKLQDLPEVDRPREKLAKYGPAKLTDTELVAIILGSGIPGLNVLEVARNVLTRFGGHSLPSAELKELSKIKGVGFNKATQLVACFELGRRLLKDKKSTLLFQPKDVYDECKDIRDHKKEHFVIFYLDSRNQAIKREVISVGTLSASIVHPREVFEPAIQANAAQLIVAHNHPSGDLSPSEEDKEITKRLVAAGKLLGIELVDHVIISKQGYLSLREQGTIEA